MKCYTIYRYVDKRLNRTVYIGKTKRLLLERVKEHEAEAKFLPYLPYVEISYYMVGSSAVMDVHEKYWIHKLQPVLNVVDRLAEGETFGMGFSIPSPNWVRYDPDYPVAIIMAKDVSDEPESELSKQWDAYHQAEREADGLESYVEQLCEAYFADVLDMDWWCMVQFPWDLETYPLPDHCMRDDGSLLSCYVRAEEIDSGTYVLFLPLSVVQIWVREGQDILSRIRRDLTRRRLDLESNGEG